MSAPILDVERWAGLHAEKLDVLLAVLGSNPALAARTLMVMPIEPAEARAIITEAIVPMGYAPQVADSLRALVPVIEQWLDRDDIGELFDREDAEARVWLWAVLFSWGWARGEEPGRG
jgi:hypothetical protein